ncbi:hypothetical protein RhiirA5_373284 [Rhizophagus irregularis]|uniref:Uncharacterized protein n=1 Tax=Rhizophagus irregularis TaxID=588596 RepID=A0A2I1EF53_9GLOM|nr:hypothetical protein RhiirA5_373284 [Rhizophagus irregularis]PKY20764.1 hypothetical protein RhiirB3_469963 [Rhizophagus irregularis]
MDNVSEFCPDSGPITFRGISLTVWTRFKQLFDQIRNEKRLNTEEMCLLVAMEIRELGGKIQKNTIQEFYERNITKRGGWAHSSLETPAIRFIISLCIATGSFLIILLYGK